MESNWNAEREVCICVARHKQVPDMDSPRWAFFFFREKPFFDVG
jgi:hypothetical protein